MGLAIFNKFGWALTQKEIQAAHTVVNTYGRNRGVINVIDQATKVSVQYLSFKDVVYTEPRLECFYSANIADVFQPRVEPSDSILTVLDSGQLPNLIRYHIKDNHPLSEHLSSPGATIKVSETVVESSILSKSSHQKVRRSVKVSYQLPPEAKGNNPRDYSKTYIGFATVDTLLHESPNSHFAVSYSGTFESWPAIEEDTGRARMRNSLATLVPIPEDYPYLKPDVVLGTAFKQYSVKLPYPEEFLLFEDNPGSPNQADGLGVILNGNVAGMVEIDNPHYDPETGLDPQGDPFSPPILLTETDEVTRGHPDILIGKSDFNFRYIKRSYKEETTDNDRTFLDSSLRDNEIIIVYPVQFTSSTMGDLGLFPSDEDKALITGIVLTKGYAFKYSYPDATFTFLKSLDLKDKRTGETAIRIELDASSELDWPNCIFKSCRYRTGWKDIDDIYRDQENTLKNSFNDGQLTIEGLYDFLS